ncbi:MAG: zinc ABC transporter substrate-binding protein [Ruminococcaceae bacterium]|nr:zinc ABC transporter substrate-binding protein [Oscillospiraceae bacterium]
MLKRLIIPVLLVMLLGGCSSAEKTDKLRIVTTIFPAYDFARQVFGDTAEITLLLKPGTESHSYDPSARDIVKIDSCDLFIYNGGESDAWVENMLRSVDVNALRMMDAVEALAEDNEGIAETEHDEHNEDEEYDEHIWTSPKNAALIVESIRNAAVKLAPENGELYESAAGEYIAEINALDEKFTELLSGEERTFVFGDRFPLLYFFREYGLKYYAAFPGCGSETEPSAQTIAFLTEKLESDTVPTVFCIELSNRKLAETLADENGLPVAEFHTCHNITADDFATESYVSLMERNYQMLKTALTNGG